MVVEPACKWKPQERPAAADLLKGRRGLEQNVESASLVEFEGCGI
jgi:hypothetical protein